MYKIMEKTNIKPRELSTNELLAALSTKQVNRNGLLIKLCILLIFAVCGLSVLSLKSIKPLSASSDEHFSLAVAPIAAASSKKDVISIPTGIVKANPFVPYRALTEDSKETVLVNDVPKFDLIAPPDTLGENADAMKIMDTVISGILYDKISSSAILNIDGNDYLVKKGDVVNNYKILAIAKDSVTVQYGKNTYKAGIGEVLNEGKINYNNISNLNKKFGGEQR